MATFEGVGGEFWTPESPDVRVRGEFTAKIEDRPEATLQGRLTAGLVPGPRPVRSRPGDMASAVKAHAAGSVARFRAISFQGQLDTGELITLLDANDHGFPGGPARYIAPLAVIGAHVALDHRYNAIRFRLDDPYWLSHLSDGETAVVEDDQSVLRVEASSDGNWLVYESATPATLRQLEMRAVSGCLALAQLALFPDKDLVASETQIRIEPDSTWLPVQGPAFCAEPESPRLDTLLPPKELTIERFARWIELNDQFDGLAWAVARKMDVPVQLQVQLLTSLVEGFHRRLTPPEEQTRFPDAKEALKRVREAAAKAAADQAEQEGLDRDVMLTVVDRALGHIGDKSFLERAESVVAEVCDAVPEIAESVAKLPNRLTDPRHSFAHQLRPKKSDPLDDRVRRWTIVSLITPWLLRALLLLRVGADPTTLREKYLECERFAFARVHIEVRAKELAWDLPPLG